MATPNALAQKQARALAALEERQERIEQKLDTLLSALQDSDKKRAPAKKEQADGKT